MGGAVGFPDSFVLRGGKLYTQLGNAVCVPVVRAIAEQILAAVEGVAVEGAADKGAADEAGRAAAAAAAASAAAAAAPAPLPGLCACEASLSLSAINLLRGVTPPAQPPPPTGAVPADYGRYGAETPSERFARVLARPPERLFCMECVCTYSLAATAEAEGERRGCVATATCVLSKGR